VFNNFVPILFGLGAIAMNRFPEGVLTMQARQFRTVLAKIRTDAPAFYQCLRYGASVYFVVFVTRLATVKHLWWLWLAITAVVAHVVRGYLVSRGFRESAGKGNPVTTDPRGEPVSRRIPEVATASPQHLSSRDDEIRKGPAPAVLTRRRSLSGTRPIVP
jgi:hypothetical protein